MACVKVRFVCVSLFFLSLFLLKPVSLAAWPEEVDLALDGNHPALALNVLQSWANLADGAEDRAMGLWMEARILALHMGDLHGAEAVLDRLLQVYPGSRIQGDARFEKGLLALQKGEEERAIREFSSFVAAFPDHPRRQSAGALLRTLRGREAALAAAPGRIRVALAFSENRIHVTGRALSLKDMVTGNRVFSGERLVLSLDGTGGIRLDGRVAGQPLLLEGGGEGFFLNGRSHRGDLQVHVAGGRFLLVNVLDLETYLRGVVPAEMPPSWPMEALKAQAVAARSYALYHMRERGFAAYDVKADTGSQMFVAEKEDPRSDAAIAATRGEVLIWAGAPALTAFHSDSGGRLEAAETLWEGDFPYLAAFSDPWTRDTPHVSWRYAIPEREVRRLLPDLRKAGTLYRVRPEGRTSSGRVASLVFGTAVGEKTVSAARFRSLAGPMLLKSTDFTLRYEGGKLVFEGRGFGHGVGMSQWGARKMAEAGRNYREILGFYYPMLHWGRMTEGM